MNCSLQPKGITVVKAAFKDSCLEILWNRPSAESANASGVCPATNNTLEGWTDQANETYAANR